jgi:hypothetical protein
VKASVKLATVLPVIHLAGEAAAQLPPLERAALYEGIAAITAGLDAHLHGHAKAAAQALREAEGHQLTFSALLRQTVQGKEAA